MIIICILLIIAIALLWYSYPDSAYYKYGSSVSSYREAPGSRYKNYNHPKEEEHRTAEQFNWRAQNFLTGLAVVFTAMAAAFAGLAYSEARRQADIAQTALESSDRPWVTLDSLRLTSPLSFNEAGDVSITVEPILINTGKSPAVFVFSHTELSITTNFQKALNNQKSYCEIVAKTNEGGILIPPNKFGVSSIIDEKHVAHADIKPFGPDKALIPFISGCVRYKYGSHYYYSGFSFVITGLPTGRPGITKELIMGNTTPADQLSLIQMPIGFFAE